MKKLDCRVSILRSADLDDGLATVEDVPAIYATRWAAWRPTMVRERMEAGGQEGRAEAIVHLRSDSKTRHIAATDRLVRDGSTYTILSVGELGRREWIELTVALAEAPEIDVTGLSPIPDSLPLDGTGWATYNDTAAAQLIPAAVRTLLTINAGTKIDSEKPADVATFWDPGQNEIIGAAGDDLHGRVKFTVTPQDGTCSYIQVDYDIGGTQGTVDSDRLPVTVGALVAKPLSLKFELYAMQTFAANGCKIYLTSDGPVSVSSKSILIKRGHRG